MLKEKKKKKKCFDLYSNEYKSYNPFLSNINFESLYVCTHLITFKKFDLLYGVSKKKKLLTLS